MGKEGSAVKRQQVHIGLRTIKTAAAVLLAMVIAGRFGGTGDKLIFAMLGAMAVIEPTFQASLEACLAQITGVSVGALISLLLIALPISGFTAVGIGIIAIIVLYNCFRRRMSPSLPCFIMVMICMSGNMDPIRYALGRIWDTAIGLSVGMAINMLVFPYDNSRKIRETVAGLDRDLTGFLEDMFDGDGRLPDGAETRRRIDALERQLSIFASQRLILHLRRQRQELERYRLCERKAKELVAHMEVLSQLERPGRLSGENRRRLTASGAAVRDPRALDSVTELDVVTNFHVAAILTLRRELLDALRASAEPSA